MTRSFWLLRPMPHGSNHMKGFLEENIIAVGYPVGRSLERMDYDDIRNILEEKNYSEGLGNVSILVNLMNKDDIVVVPDNNGRDVYFGQIESEYIYNATLDKDEKGSGYPHQRKVKWFFDKKPLLRSTLSEELRGSLRYPGTVAQLTKHADYISELLNLDSQKNSETTSLKKEAEKVLREFLKSDSEEYRLRAAEIILSAK